MCGSMVDIKSATAENRRGKKKEETTTRKYDGLPYCIRAAIIRQFDSHKDSQALRVKYCIVGIPHSAATWFGWGNKSFESRF